MSTPQINPATAKVIEQARSWLRQDPDPITRDELAGLVTQAESGSAEANADLSDRFSGRLEFGTAGLRGALGAGPMRMNRVVVAQAAAGLAEYLKGQYLKSPYQKSQNRPGHQPSIVIGYDGRVGSKQFAADTAEICAGAGLRTILLPEMLPTPVLAYAVRHLAADAGVMVTASHNPPQDNGYKVYLGGDNGGAQIVAPVDQDIAEHIARIAQTTIKDLVRSDQYEIADSSLADSYARVTASVAPAPAAAPGMRWVYTAMHGVGAKTFLRTLKLAGFAEPYTVSRQIDPNPAFPTVAFPNPEEPGAMDLSIALARKVGAEFILAHDPDADRLAVAIPDPTLAGGWRRLSGNEVGLLLAVRAAQLTQSETPKAGVLASSLVSSPAMAVIAQRHDLGHVETLTGFKWIARVPDLIYGYEEALGYLVNPETVRDKDGISAGIAVLNLAAEAKQNGLRLIDLLDDIGREYGYFASDQVSIRFQDLRSITAIMTSLRQSPPENIGEFVVQAAEDLMRPGGALPPGDILRYHLVNGSRIIIRPSGTEPKLKVYIDVQSSSAAQARLQAFELHGLIEQLLAQHQPVAAADR